LSVKPSEIVSYLKSRGLKLSLAESLTGGMIASGIVDVPGASDIFEGSVVSYSDAVKMNVLGVSGETLDEHTAVSFECAVGMARGARKIMSSDIAVSVTGVAGPGPAYDGQPQGTVFIGFSDKNGEGAVLKLFEGDRDEVRRQTRDAAYDLIMERALKL